MNSIAQSNVVVMDRDLQEIGASCHNCSRVGRCPASGRPEAFGAAGQPMQKVVKSGRVVFGSGDCFDGIYVVRAGFFKSYTVDADGTMQVTGFHLPGEFFGMDGLEDGMHKEYVQALDTGSICRIPLGAFLGGASSTPSQDWSSQMTMSLLKLMSNTIQRDRATFFNFGKTTAKGRLSSFLADLADRMALGGYDRSAFRLCMSRTDIANHLCLALETVSRLFTQLQVEQVIEVSGRELRIIDKAALRAKPVSHATEAAS
jgi:CRP/FNR family transcriptional regulator